MKNTLVKSIKSEEPLAGGILEDQLIELDATANRRYEGKRIRLVRVGTATKHGIRVHSQ